MDFRDPHSLPLASADVDKPDKGAIDLIDVRSSDIADPLEFIFCEPRLSRGRTRGRIRRFTRVSVQQDRLNNRHAGEVTIPNLPPFMDLARSERFEIDSRGYESALHVSRRPVIEGPYHFFVPELNARFSFRPTLVGAKVFRRGKPAKLNGGVIVPFLFVFAHRRGKPVDRDDLIYIMRELESSDNDQAGEPVRLKQNLSRIRRELEQIGLTITEGDDLRLIVI